MKSELRARLEKIAPYGVRIRFTDTGKDSEYNNGVSAIIEKILKDARIVKTLDDAGNSSTCISFEFQPVEVDTVEKLVQDLASPAECKPISYYIERARKLMEVK